MSGGHRSFLSLMPEDLSTTQARRSPPRRPRHGSYVIQFFESTRQELNLDIPYL
jgi:hypothetical protein